MKIKTKLILLCLIPILGIILVQTIVAYKTNRDLEESVTEKIELKTLLIGHELGQMIKERLQIWKPYTHNQNLQKFLTISNKEFETMRNRTEEVYRRNKNWGLDLDLINSLENNEVTKDITQRQTELSLNYDYQIFPEIFVTNKYGVNIAQTNTTSDYYQADETWWERAVKTGEYISDLNLDKSSGTYSINTARAIYDKEKNLLGVIKVIYNTRELSQFLEMQLKDSIEKGILLDNNNRIIRDTKRPEKTLQGYGHLIPQSLADHELATPNSAYSVYNRNIEDEVLTTISNIRISNDLQLKLLLEVKTQELFKAINYQHESLLFTFLALLTVVTFTTWQISTSITNRVSSFVELTKSIASGKYIPGAVKKGQDELSVLSNALFAMAGEIDTQSEKIKKKNRELNEFAYIASHDLTSPIATIYRSAEILKSELNSSISDGHKMLLELVIKNCNTSSKLVRDLLNYSRLNNQDPDYEIVNLENVISIVNQNLDEQIKESSALVEVTNLPKVISNQTAMIQLFQNLIINSLTYRSQSEPHIKIFSSKENGETIFTVQDNGRGIPEQEQEMVFEIFNRGAEDNKSVGSGIGLAICKRVIEQHNGRIWIDSNKNKNLGTKVLFTLNTN